MGRADATCVHGRGSAVGKPNTTRHPRRPLSSGVRRLYAKALPTARTGPLYNAISYPTKISAETVALFIATHTRPGDTVLDVFGGSGSTGLAALLCDRPTDRMLSLAESLGAEPVWGPRKAVLYELGALGSFIAAAMCDPPGPDRFREAAEDLVASMDADCGWMYEALDPEGTTGSVRHIIWSEIVACPSCGAETSYWNAAVRQRPLRLERIFRCGECRRDVQLEDAPRVTETTFDPVLGTEIERRKRVPCRVYGRSGKATWQRPAIDADLRLSEKTASLEPPLRAPRVPLDWGDLYRSGYHQGISHLHHFYTPRNFHAIAGLWERIKTYDADLRPALRLLVLSFNASHSTLMTRVVVKNGQNDFVLTGAQSGVLYVSGLPVEKNVLAGVRRKIGTLAAAFRQVSGSQSRVTVHNASSTRLALPSESIQYVFTDPPFGGYIPYAEVNQLNEAWLGTLTQRSDEVIVSPAQGKGVDEYARLMAQVFAEIERVLTPSGAATVVFHSARAEIWQSLYNAFTSAGLGVALTSVLDKLQASFKQTVAQTAVKGDPLMLLTKQAPGLAASTDSIDDIVERVVAVGATRGTAEQTRERLFSRLVAACLERGVPISMSAAEFYGRLAKPRDGRER